MDTLPAPIPSRRSSRWIIPILLACTGMGVASAVIWQASNAAFTATTQNGTNSWSTGSVALTDNDSNAVLFSVTGMYPGQTASRCIRVTYAGDLTNASVKLYASSLVDTDGLGSLIDLVIDEGTGSSTFGDCTGFSSARNLFTGTLATLGTTNTAWASALPAASPWAPAATNETKDYRFTYTFSNSATNTAQGDSASVSFVWEARTP